MVPVPSRLHGHRTREKPLHGVRVTVKDIIHLKGVETTGQSKSYGMLYDSPQPETASIISQLRNLGAAIIGKTKCTQFACSDQPTADWVEFHCPWNPRGDRHLSPRGSSTGTCVAVAGYDWCDVGVGSDSQPTTIVFFVRQISQSHGRTHKSATTVKKTQFHHQKTVQLNTHSKQRAKKCMH